MAKEKEISFTIRAKDAASAVMKEVEHATKSTVDKLLGFKEALHLLTAAAAAFSLAEVIKDIVDLGIAADKTFRQIAANLPTFTAGLHDLKEEIAALASESGRGLEDMQHSAAAIAKMGVASAEELGQQLKAATALADATGASVDESAQLLIQLRREFHLTGEEALGTGAKLASAAKGHVDVVELFTAFQAATPIFQKFNIDLDTATKAIVAMVESGRGLRQIRAELNAQDAAGIREWATQAHIAANYMEDLNQRIKENREATSTEITRVKNAWHENLESIGESIQTFLIGPLQAVAGLLQSFHQRDIGSQFGIASLSETLRGGTIWDRGSHGTSGTWGDEPDGKSSFKPPLTVAERKAIEEAAKKIRELRGEVELLTRTSEDATPKSEQFAQAMGKWAVKALEANMDFAEFQGTLEQLQITLARLEGEEALKRIDKATKDAESAFADLDSAMAKFAGGAVAQLDAEYGQLVKKLDEARTKIADIGALEKFDANVKQLKESWQELRAAVADTAEATKLVQSIQDDLATKPMTSQQIADQLSVLVARGEEVRKKMNAATNPAVAAEYRKELGLINGEVQDLYGAWDALQVPLEDNKKRILDIANAWATLGRSVIAAGQAIGQMNDKTAALLQNVVSLGDGIAKIIAGGENTKVGVVESLTAVVAIVAQLIKHGPTAAQIAEVTASAERLVAGLRRQLDPVDSLANRIADARQTSADARAQTEKELAGKFYEGMRETQLARLNALEAARIAQLNMEFVAQQKLLVEDLEVRRLRATGHAEEADALAFALAQQREYAQAVKDGADATTLAALAATQAAEAQQHAADVAHATAAKAYSDAQAAVDRDIHAHGITDPTEIFKKKAQALAQLGGSLGDFLKTFDLEHLTPADIDAIKKQLVGWLDTIKDSPEAFDLAGLSIDELIDILFGLSDAADAATAGLTGAIQHLTDAAAQLSNDERIFGTTAEAHAKNVGALGGFELGDISTPEGRDRAIAELQARYAVARAKFGGDNQYAKSIADTIEALRAIPFGGGAAGRAGGGSLGAGEISAISHGFQSLTTVQGDRMADELLRIGNDVHAIRELMEQRIAIPQFAPVNPFGGAAALAASGSGSITIGTLDIHVASGGGDPGAQGREIADAFIDEVRRLDASLGRRVLIQRRRNGDIRVTPS